MLRVGLLAYVKSIRKYYTLRVGLHVKSRHRPIYAKSRHRLYVMSRPIYLSIYRN